MAHQPQNLVATATSSTAIDLSWDDVDTLDDELYDIERDGVIVEQDVAGTTYSDTGLSADTEYTYRVRAVGGTEVGFSPDDLAALAVWVDFSDVSTLFTDTARTTPVTADGNIIRGISDKSGNARHLSGSAGPTYTTAVLNGQSVARFFPDMPLDTASLSLTQPTTIFLVMNMPSPTAAQMNIIDAASGDRQVLYLATPTGFSGLYAGAGLSGVAPALDDAVTRVFVARFNGASSFIYLNGGTANVSGNAGTQGIGALRIGCAIDGTTDYTGDLGEVLVYTSAMSLADLNLVGAYLGDKWGFTWTTAT